MKLRINQKAAKYMAKLTKQQQFKQDVSKALAQIKDKVFVNAFKANQERIHDTAKEKGWWDAPRRDGELIALCHSELSEALEALREDIKSDDKVPEFLGVEAELADVVIRIMDMAQARHWRVAEAIVAKMAVNQGRSRMHGGKKF